jgi:hypothetical protein
MIGSNRDHDTGEDAGGYKRDPLATVIIAASLFFAALTLITAGCKSNDDSDFSITKDDGTWVCEHTGPYASVRTPILYDCEHVLSGRKVKSIRVTEFDTVYELSEGTK